MGVYSADQSQWLQQAILSVVNQTYKNFLFGIVIDGNIDCSLNGYLNKLCLEHDNILLVKSESNQGLSSSMNFLIEWMLENAPQAKYLFRMDSDDISLPDRFEKQIAFFE
mmetsp:Transcript_21665/g.27810  ORF Transcript_21665/g.27810 Transcript_21665/m.27810 type:complete len:110 (+) Transcript_21665:88-417(+)